MKQSMFHQSRKKARIALAVLTLCGFTCLGGINHSLANENESITAQTLSPGDNDLQEAYVRGGHIYYWSAFVTVIGYYDWVASPYTTLYGLQNNADLYTMSYHGEVGNTALGSRIRTFGNHTTGLGYGNMAIGDHTLVLGSHNNYLEPPSRRDKEKDKGKSYEVVIGSYNETQELHSLAIGSGVKTGIRYDEKLGKDVDDALTNKATGKYANAIGFLNNAEGINSIALGSGSFTNKTDNKYNEATGAYSIALGHINRVNGADSSAVGSNNFISKGHSYGFGSDNNIEADYSSAVGSSNSIHAGFSHVFGFDNTIWAEYSYAVGSSNSIHATYSHVFGFDNEMWGNHSNVIGSSNAIYGDQSNAFGFQNEVTRKYSLSLGSWNKVNATEDLGSFLTTTDSADASLAGTTVTDRNETSAIAIGYHNEVSSNRSLAVGFQVKSGTENGAQYTIAIGDEATAIGEDSIGIGHNTKIDALGAISIGMKSFVTENNTGLVTNGIAIGRESSVTSEDSKAIENAVAIGYGSQATDSYTVSFGGSANDDTKEPAITRRLTNLAEGTADSDATTVDQVNKKIAGGIKDLYVKIDDEKKGIQPAADDLNKQIKGNKAKIGTGDLNVTDLHGKSVNDLTGAANAINEKVDKAFTDMGDMTQLADGVKKDGSTLVDAINMVYETGTKASEAIGTLDDLNTTKKDSVVSAINDVKGNTDSNTNHIGDMSRLDARVRNKEGNTTLVDAINNAYNARVEEGKSPAEVQNLIRKLVGPLDQLKTKNNDNAVVAINEVKDYTDKNAEHIGTLADLHTEEKTNLVGAVNEVNDKVGNLDDLNEDIKTSNPMARSVNQVESLVQAVNRMDDKIKNTSGYVGNVKELDADIRSDTVVGATNKLNRKVDRLGSRLNKVGAGVAALAALQPMDYDPDDKLSFVAGFGNYGGESSIALGAFYRSNENVMLNIGGNMGDGENMVNAGLSFSFGNGSHGATSYGAIAKKMTVRDTEIAALQAKLEEEHVRDAQQGAMMEEQKARLEKIEAMIQQLSNK